MTAEELKYSCNRARRRPRPTNNLLEVWQNLAPFSGRPIGAAVEALLTKVFNRQSSVSPIVVFYVAPVVFPYNQLNSHHAHRCYHLWACPERVNTLRARWEDDRRPLRVWFSQCEGMLAHWLSGQPERALVLKVSYSQWAAIILSVCPESINSLSAKSVLAGEKLVATYSIST